mgnify:CR=1 FL=1
MNREPKCTRCGALAGTNDRPAVKGDPERCYWAAGQRSEAAYDNCARRAGERTAALEADVARLKEERDALRAQLATERELRAASDDQLMHVLGSQADKDTAFYREMRAELTALRSAPPASVRTAAEAWLRWREEFGLPHSRETTLMTAIREWLAAPPAGDAPAKETR